MKMPIAGWILSRKAVSSVWYVHMRSAGARVVPLLPASRYAEANIQSPLFTRRAES